MGFDLSNGFSKKIPMLKNQNKKKGFNNTSVES